MKCTIVVVNILTTVYLSKNSGNLIEVYAQSYASGNWQKMWSGSADSSLTNSGT